MGRKSSLGWLNPALYSGARAFNDVTTGKTSGGIVGGFPAAPPGRDGFGTVQYKPPPKRSGEHVCFLPGLCWPSSLRQFKLFRTKRHCYMQQRGRV